MPSICFVILDVKLRLSSFAFEGEGVGGVESSFPSIAKWKTEYRLALVVTLFV